MVSKKNYKMLINGKWVNSSDKKRFDSLNPFTGDVWCSVPEATIEDVDKAVNSAKNAFEKSKWALMTPSERGECLNKLANLLEKKSEFLGKIESLDTGKLYNETKWQAKYIAKFFRFFAGCADKISGDTLPIDKKDLFVYTVRVPLGVIAAVVPWNSQLFLVAVKIAPALAAGNTIVLKCSEHASAPMLEFGKLIEKSGIPPGVVNIITGHASPCGEALTSHPNISRISFTGGEEAAKKIIINSVNNLAAISLELGGKSPIIVFDDAEIESAINACMAGIFGASGQSCVAGSRLYIHEKLSVKFINKLVEKVKKIKFGDPLLKSTQMGPLCTKKQKQKINEEIEIAKKEGAKIIYENSRSNDESFFFSPTIIECPNNKIKIMHTELFGPVLSFHTFKNEEEVINLSNETKYGLAAGIFTKNISRALRVSENIRAGIIWINTYRVVSPIAEFGGFNQSGTGRESGFQAIYDYTNTKTVWINTSEKPIENPFIMR